MYNCLFCRRIKIRRVANLMLSLVNGFQNKDLTSNSTLNTVFASYNIQCQSIAIQHRIVEICVVAAIFCYETYCSSRVLIKLSGYHIRYIESPG